MLLGGKGTSRNLPESGCASALNLITAAGINQQVLLNLLLRLDRGGQVSRVVREIWPQVRDKATQLHLARRAGYTC